MHCFEKYFYKLIKDRSRREDEVSTLLSSLAWENSVTIDQILRPRYERLGVDRLAGD